MRVWARGALCTTHPRPPVSGTPRSARRRVTRAAPDPGVNLRRAPPREAVRLRQALLRDADTMLRLLAVLCVPTKGPRLRAHRLVRASGRAAAGAAQPAGTMAPFARNDKTILEIALPALVGFKPVSLETARLVDASPTARLLPSHAPRRWEFRGPPARVPRPALDGRGGWLAVAAAVRYAPATPRRRGAGPQRHATHSTQRGPREGERDESTPPTRNHTGASSRSSSRPTRTRRSNASRRARMWAVLWSTSTVP